GHAGSAAAVSGGRLGSHAHDRHAVDGQVERVLRIRAGGCEPGEGERAHPLGVEDRDRARERLAARVGQAHVGVEAGVAGDDARDRHLQAAGVRDAVAVAVGLVGVVGGRAVVAGVADAVGVGVGLIGVVGVRAVVDGVADAVAVLVGADRAAGTGVADTVTVVVGLIGVGNGRAVVAGVADAVAVAVGLVRVVGERAIVASATEAV